ncbi:MAG: flagellar type III secretion system pore protein FliP [Parvularculaceae bacterium]|nr:flagellar type III secretion system pore protein FliP [Parvularculaceae bacterium]
MTRGKFIIAAATLLAAALIAGAASAAPAAAAPLAEAAGGLSARVIQIFLLVTVLSLAPGIAMMITCLPFMVIVFSILRQAIGLQQAPPNMLIMSLSIFLTYFVMEPVFTASWKDGVQPMLNKDISEEQAFDRAIAPFRGFMEKRVSAKAIDTLTEVAPERKAEDGVTPLSVLVPAFMLSEIQRAFAIGFVIFLPFVIIDLIVASVLMAMGMVVVPPAIVALPFKLAFFVMANGWIEIAGALVKGYGP